VINFELSQKSDTEFSQYLENLPPKRREALISPPSLLEKGVGG
jgi:hypothetical protein